MAYDSTAREGSILLSGVASSNYRGTAVGLGPITCSSDDATEDGPLPRLDSFAECSSAVQGEKDVAVPGCIDSGDGDMLPGVLVPGQQPQRVMRKRSTRFMLPPAD